MSADQVAVCNNCGFRIFKVAGEDWLHEVSRLRWCEPPKAAPLSGSERVLLFDLQRLVVSE